MTNFKRTTIILSSLIVILVLVMAGYNLLFKKESPQKETEGTEEPWVTNIEPSPENNISQITKEAILSPWVGDNKVQYFAAQNGYLLESNFNGGQVKEISSIDLNNLQKAVWSPDGNQAICLFDQSEKILYNFKEGRSNTLNSSIQWVAWSPDKNKVAYQFYDNKTQANKISTANPDGSDWQNIFNTRLKDLIIEWPQPNLISLRTKPSGLAESTVYTLNPNTQKLTKILKDRYGLDLIWSKQGNKILFSETDSNGKNLTLKTANPEGQVLEDLKVATLPSKCVFSSDERKIYCAAPKAIPEGMTMPDDYFQGKDYQDYQDYLWLINTETKEKSLLVEAEQLPEKLDAFYLKLDEDEDNLFFINKENGFLYRLELD